MLNFIKKLFGMSTAEKKQIDLDFGEICYFKEGSWQMTGSWTISDKRANICCIDIPGNSEGPSHAAREFLLGKKHSIENIWSAYREKLQCVLNDNALNPRNLNPEELLTIESFAGESDDDWEVSFEADTEHDKEWIHISFVSRCGNEQVVITR